MSQPPPEAVPPPERVLFQGKARFFPFAPDEPEFSCQVTESQLVLAAPESLVIPLHRLETCYVTMLEGVPLDPGSARLAQARLEYRDSLDRRQTRTLAMEAAEARTFSQVLFSAQLEYASFWRRFWAILVDGLIMSPVSYGLLFINPDAWVWVMGILEPVYHIAFWTWRGQTPGKMLLGIRIVRVDGKRIGLGRAIIRYIVYPLSAILLLIGYLMIIWDSKKQSLHDKAAGTCVVKAA